MRAEGAERRVNHVRTHRDRAGAIRTSDLELTTPKRSHSPVPTSGSPHRPVSATERQPSLGWIGARTSGNTAPVNVASELARSGWTMPASRAWTAVDDPLGVKDFATRHAPLENSPQVYTTVQEEDGAFQVIFGQ